MAAYDGPQVEDMILRFATDLTVPFSNNTAERARYFDMCHPFFVFCNRAVPPLRNGAVRELREFRLSGAVSELCSRRREHRHFCDLPALLVL
jgi:hypothetical protein